MCHVTSAVSPRLSTRILPLILHLDAPGARTIAHSSLRDAESLERLASGCGVQLWMLQAGSSESTESTEGTESTERAALAQPCLEMLQQPPQTQTLNSKPMYTPAEQQRLEQLEQQAKLAASTQQIAELPPGWVRQWDMARQVCMCVCVCVCHVTSAMAHGAAGVCVCVT